ncbi:PQQ-binding-like beta-propeller repeat protein [Pseudonocardia broussonetiae]|uniref:PQQ-like beta-propeller repeat protein n=1 Tax=Pseudonocardia broussonetiae TaxID=2736640 RepID=A0A6M6JAB5_9PSEU|nr:PQQ-binding-like beta-propeller repeat protein [Pseudonocardia broussonetiae]QJY44798.1 PQQ-like beta-propeller repeat protein [Pseudonocardia broussonetiae]
MHAGQSLDDLWRRFDELARLVLSDGEALKGLRYVSIREFRRGIFKGKSHSAYKLWTKHPDSDSRDSPEDYYLVRDGRLARGSNHDAVDLVVRGYLQEHHLRPMLLGSITALEKIVVRQEDARRPKLDRAPDLDDNPRVQWQIARGEADGASELAGARELGADRLVAIYTNYTFGSSRRTFQVEILDARQKQVLSRFGPSDFGYVDGKVSLAGVAVSGETIFLTVSAGGFGEIVAVKAPLGHILWQKPLESNCEDSPVSVSVDQVLVGTVNGDISLLNTKDGKRVWQWKGGAVSHRYFSEYDQEYRHEASKAVSEPACDGDSVFVSHLSLGCVRLDLATGEQLWTTGRAAVATTVFGPTVIGDLVVFPCDGGLVAACEVSSGELRWRKLIGEIWASPPAFDGKMLYIASSNGVDSASKSKLAAVESETGRVRWQVDIPSGPVDRPVLVQDALYLNGRLYDIMGGQLLMDLSDFAAPRAYGIGKGVLIKKGSDLCFIQ